MNQVKRTRVIAFDPKLKTITQTYVTGLRDMQALVGGLICLAGQTGFVGGDPSDVFVNDEGLFEKEQHFFMVPGIEQPLCGPGFIIGGPDEGGESTDCELTLSDAAKLIRFLSSAEMSEELAKLLS